MVRGHVMMWQVVVIIHEERNFFLGCRTGRARWRGKWHRPEMCCKVEDNAEIPHYSWQLQNVLESLVRLSLWWWCHTERVIVVNYVLMLNLFWIIIQQNAVFLFWVVWLGMNLSETLVQEICAKTGEMSFWLAKICWEIEYYGSS